ncbi:MAG: NAD(P)-binding domain-containing protein [Gammaproteobacteria bacterium]|nr:NAD(P)-binding domain-containing protein [Gammaproteobacteria bacterium]
MKVGFFGTGNMARAVGGALAVAGHEVWFGSRDEGKARGVAAEIGHGAQGDGNDPVAQACEVLVSSIRDVPSAYLRATDGLDGKVLIDLNNRDFPREYHGDEFLQSLASAAQRDVPGAKVVKALNNQAMEVFNADAEALRSAGIQGFIAGDDADAKDVVAALLRDIGLTPVDFGALSNAWLLEVQADILRTYLFATGNLLATPALIDAPQAAPRFGERRKGTY